MELMLWIQSTAENGLTQLADWLWSDWLLFALVGLGVVYTIGTGLVQLRRFPLAVRRITQGWGKKVGSERGISPVQALLFALGSCVGSGNIVGVSTALIAGGPGALFWMWVAAFFGMATKFGEIVLGLCYRSRNAEGRYIGGPMYYIAQGLKVPALGTLVAILLFIQNAGGTLIQSNVIAKVVHANFRLPTFVTGVIVATLMIIIIHGGFKRLVHVEQKLVPLMACLYIGGGLAVVLFNLSSLPEVFSRIFHEALTFRAGLGGAGAIAMRYGVARGLYSNEAGEGSAAVIHSTAEVKHPVEQGLMGLAEVFVDTMIICSNTGLAVLASGIPLNGADASTLAAQAFGSVFAPMQYIVYVSLVLFAFTSLMSQWLFGQVSLQYLKFARGDQIYKIIFPIAVLLGSVSTIKAVWSLQDCALGLLIIPNIMAMIVLVPKVGRLNRAYFREGKNEKR